MTVRMCFFVIRAARELRFRVGPAVPTIFLLLADLTRESDVSDWSELWKHGPDPLWRIGRNWPRDDMQAVSFLRNDLESALRRGYNIHEDVLALGKLALGDLPKKEKAVVASANSDPSTFETQHRLPGNKQTITSVSHSLPEEFALPFIRRGTLIFQDRPVRLVGLEFLAALESPLSEDRGGNGPGQLG